MSPTLSPPDAPDTLGPLNAPGLASRGLPFLALIVGIYALSPLGSAEYNLPLVALSAMLVFLIIAAAVWVPWARFDRKWQLAIPLAMFGVSPVLRHGTGGADSGVTLLLIPFLWIALYHSRRGLWAALAGVAFAYGVPQLVFGSAEYPDPELELRRAITIMMLYGATTWIVQRLIAQLRRNRLELAGSLRATEDASHRLERANVDLKESNANLETAYERERGMVEQLTELDRMKSRFVAVASHELRTPLTSITGFSQTIMDRWGDLSDEDKRSFIGLIEQQGRRLANLVDDLLVLSRIQSDTIESHPRAIDLMVVIDEVLSATDMCDRVEIECPSGLNVLADGGHLYQILLNFVTNAEKYGRAPIIIEAASSSDEWIDVRVRDHGDGVSEQFIPRLFEEFERDTQHEEAGIQGTGLGLSIVRGLVQAQGGSAWYEHNTPSGAVFAVRLPAVVD